MSLLDVRNLSVRFGGVTAVDDVSFSLERGATLGIVGESGSGKSVTCRALMRLLSPNARIEGTADFEGRDLLSLPEKALDGVRGKRIAMIFQTPASHLDPLMRIGDQVAETLHKHTDMRGRAVREEVVRLLDVVRIPDPEKWVRAFPHQLSGGMKQRVMIAGAWPVSRICCSRTSRPRRWTPRCRKACWTFWRNCAGNGTCR